MASEVYISPKRAPVKTPIDLNETLANVEDYLLRTRRLASFGARNILRTIRMIATTYNTLEPTTELAAVVEADARERELKDNTIRLYLAAIEYWHAAMNPNLEKKDRLVLSKPRITTHREVRLTTLERKTILNDEDMTVRDAAIIAVALYAGLRRKEMANLNLKDVNMQKCELYVKDNRDKDIQFSGTKNHKNRVVVMHPNLKATLAEYLIWRVQQVGKGTEALFLNYKGGRMSVDGLGQLIARITKKSIGRAVSPHELRHSCASWMANSGMPIEQVKGQMGHSSLDVTMLYVHHDSSEVLKSLSKLPAY